MGQDFVVLHYPQYIDEEYVTVPTLIYYEDLVFNEESQQYEPTIFEYVLETMKLVILDNCYEQEDEKQSYKQKQENEKVLDFLKEVDKFESKIKDFLSGQNKGKERVIDFFVEKEGTFENLSNEFRGLMNDRRR